MRAIHCERKRDDPRSRIHCAALDSDARLERVLGDFGHVQDQIAASAPTRTAAATGHQEVLDSGCCLEPRRPPPVDVVIATTDHLGTVIGRSEDGQDRVVTASDRVDLNTARDSGHEPEEDGSTVSALLWPAWRGLGRVLTVTERQGTYFERARSGVVGRYLRSCGRDGAERHERDRRPHHPESCQSVHPVPPFTGPLSEAVLDPTKA